MNGWEIVLLIGNIVWAVIVGYTIAAVWEINRRAKRIEKLAAVSNIAIMLILEKLSGDNNKKDEDAGKKKSVKKATKKSTKKGEK